MGWKENDLFDMKIKNLMMSHQKNSEISHTKIFVGVTMVSFYFTPPKIFDP